MKKTAWSHLPNAAHIDAIIASAKANPSEWGAAYYEAYHAAQAAAREAAWRAVRDAARIAVRGAAWRAVRNSAGYAAGDAARIAIAALVAWDHAAKYLDMTLDELGVWHALSGDPACLLLLPYAHARELIAAEEEVLA